MNIPTESGFTEPKYYAFRKWLDALCSSSENMSIDALGIENHTHTIHGTGIFTYTYHKNQPFI